jgi:Flp pilus assembly protein TadD
VAILPANILISDPSSEWMAAAVPLVLEQDFSTSRNLISAAVDGESGAYQAGATTALRTTLENRQGRLRLQATITDLATQCNREVLTMENSGSVLVPALNELAKRIDSGASDFSTKNDRALQAYVAAAQSPNPRTRVQLLSDAIRADTEFGLGYIALLEIVAPTGQENIASVLASARSHENSFTPLDRARFEAVASRLTHAQLPDQAKAAEAVLRLAPNDVDTLASLGTVKFLEGDANGGQQHFGRALQIDPGNANLRQQLGIGLLETKRFSDAERVLGALSNNPAILPTLATCILLEGDAIRANAVADKYFALQPVGDPYTVLFRGTWLAISGQTPKAIEYLEQSNFADARVRSIAFSQIAIWQAMAKDFAAAKKSASLAQAADPRPGSVASIAVLIANAGQPSDQWRREVEAAPIIANPAARQAVLGYGLFLQGRYSESAQLWRTAVEASGDTDLRARAMLASSLEKAGSAEEAHKILVQPFVPDLGDLYAAISFAEMRRSVAWRH